MILVKVPLLKARNFSFVSSLLKCNACPAFENIIRRMAKSFVPIVGAWARKYCQARSSTLNQSSWIMNKSRLLWTIITLSLILGCSFLSSASNPTPDLFATLQASTPSSFSSPAATQPGATPDFNFSTLVPSTLSTSSRQSSIPPPSSSDRLTGHIVFTCQIFKVQASNQVCIMNADGSGWRRLTTDNSRQHWYASLSPDGQSVFYSAFREANVHEIYEMTLVDGN